MVVHEMDCIYTIAGAVEYYCSCGYVPRSEESAEDHMLYYSVPTSQADVAEKIFESMVLFYAKEPEEWRAMYGAGTEPPDRHLRVLAKWLSGEGWRK